MKFRTGRSRTQKRHRVKSARRRRSLQSDVASESRHGFFGRRKQRIADLNADTLNVESLSTLDSMDEQQQISVQQHSDTISSTTTTTTTTTGRTEYSHKRVHEESAPLAAASELTWKSPIRGSWAVLRRPAWGFREGGKRLVDEGANRRRSISTDAPLVQKNINDNKSLCPRPPLDIQPCSVRTFIHDTTPSTGVLSSTSMVTYISPRSISSNQAYGRRRSNIPKTSFCESPTFNLLLAGSATCDVEATKSETVPNSHFLQGVVRRLGTHMTRRRRSLPSATDFPC